MVHTISHGLGSHGTCLCGCLLTWGWYTFLRTSMKKDVPWNGNWHPLHWRQFQWYLTWLSGKRTVFPDSFLWHSPQWLIARLLIEYRLLRAGLVKLLEGVTLLLSNRLLNGFVMRWMMGKLVCCDKGEEQADLSSLSTGEDRLSSPMTLPKYLYAHSEFHH